MYGYEYQVMIVCGGQDCSGMVANALTNGGQAETLEALQLEHVPRERAPVALARRVHVLVLVAGHHWRAPVGRIICAK